MKSVYSAVRTGSLNTAVCGSSLEGLIMCTLLGKIYVVNINLIITAEHIVLCLKYINKTILCTPSDTNVCLSVIIILLLVTVPAFKFFFCKYWPEDGLLRSKRVANSTITVKYYIVVSDRVHT